MSLKWYYGLENQNRQGEKLIPFICDNPPAVNEEVVGKKTSLYPLGVAIYDLTWKQCTVGLKWFILYWQGPLQVGMGGAWFNLQILSCVHVIGCKKSAYFRFVGYEIAFLENMN